MNPAASHNLMLFPAPGDFLERNLKPAVEAATAAVVSPSSKDQYRTQSRTFLRWHAERYPGQMPSRSTVLEYKSWRINLGLSTSSVNMGLAVVRRIVGEAAELGILKPEVAIAIQKVRSVARRGTRQGVWLHPEEAEALLAAARAGEKPVQGIRDAAVLAVMLGCGLRRREVAALSLDQVREIWGRPAIVDLRGKGGKTRSIPMPGWCKTLVDEWIRAGGIRAGNLFRRMTKYDVPAGKGLANHGVAVIVKRVARRLGIAVAAHDLRRSFAKMSRHGGADLEQIQYSLGHSQITTTMRYIGENQDFADAPCDRLGIRAEHLGSPPRIPPAATMAAPADVCKPERREDDALEKVRS